jgi:hypothetical protein
MPLFGKIARALDQATGSAAPRKLLNQYIRDYGEITDLTIDAPRKRITARLLLHGEREPLDVTVEEYDLIRTGESASFVVRAADSDRAWLNAVLNRFIVGRAWEVPAKAVALVEGLLG